MITRIIQLTDCHLMADPQAELKGICTRARFDRVLADIRARHPEVDKLIVTGDLTHDEKLETYATLKELLAGWMPKLRVIPGNHDDRALMREVFGERIQVVERRNVFAEIIGGWRLIGLDSHVPGQLYGELGSEQLNWLEQQLDADTRLHSCLFLHHPPVSVKSPWLDRIGLTDAEGLLEVVSRRSSVRVVCCGHVHQERSVSVGATAIFTTPSAGVQFRPETESLEVDAAWPGYRILDLYGDGRFDSRVERVQL